MKREALTVVTLIALFAAAVPAHAGHGATPPPPACADADRGVVAVTLQVDGEDATGCMGVPSYAIPEYEPEWLLVFAHGHGQSAAAWTNHMARYAEAGVPSITMDYRGAWNEFPLMAGAEDTVAAAEFLQDLYPGDQTVVLFGVSMGGTVSGMAAAMAPAGTFDHWFMVEGLSMLAETWAEASAAEPGTAAEIERETGGTPADAPEAYVARSPALRTAEMKANGIASAVVVHPLNDGRVPVNQGVESFAALTAVGIPTEFTLVLRGDPDELGSTGTGALGLGATDPYHHLAGHAWEGSSTHIVMRTAFDRLDALLGGEAVTPGVGVADRELGTLP